MVQNALKEMIQRSVTLRCNVTIYEKLDVRGLIIDFKSPHKNFNANTSNFFQSLYNKNVIIIKCNLPSPFIWEIIFLILKISKYHRLVLSTEAVSYNALYFLKRIGIRGLLSESPELSLEMPFETKILNNSGSLRIFEKLHGLSPTEIEILYHVSQGLGNAEIAELISRSYHTIKNHKINIVRKAGLKHCNQLFELVSDLKSNFY